MSTESVMPSNHLILCHPLLLLPSIFPSIRVFSNELLFASGGQSIGASALASVLPKNVQDWFPLGLTGLISLLSKGLWRVLSGTTVQKHPFNSHPLLWSNSHIHTWLLEKPLLWLFVNKVMSQLFNMLSSFVIAVPPRSKHLFIFTVWSDFGAQVKKICHCFHFFPFYLPWSDGTGCNDFSFLDRVSSQLFQSPLALLSRGSSVTLCFLP